MWIICEDGSAINSDHIARLREDGYGISADTPGLPVPSKHIGDNISVKDLVVNIASGTKIMEVR